MANCNAIAYTSGALGTERGNGAIAIGAVSPLYWRLNFITAAISGDADTIPYTPNIAINAVTVYGVWKGCCNMTTNDKSRPRFELMVTKEGIPESVVCLECGWSTNALIETLKHNHNPCTEYVLFNGKALKCEKVQGHSDVHSVSVNHGGRISWKEEK